MAGATRPDRLSPKSPGFEQELADNGIYMRGTVQKPQNLHEIRVHLARRRTSLSSSKFSAADFNDFVEDNRQADTESQVMSQVIPTIVGKDDKRHLSMGDIRFKNLEPFADGQVAAPAPKRYYGAAPKDIDRRVRQDLGSHILPSTSLHRPAVPNYFLEAKPRAGHLVVANLHACHDGAVGARAMHSLQNYKVDDPVYDEKARTITCVYHGGLLELYTHHLTEPTSPGGKPEYHMNQVASVSLTASPRSFREGATAYRNARDWAKTQRGEMIARANAKARRSSLETVSSTNTDNNRASSATAEAEDTELENSVEASS
jgi:hypothetical protein